jgi:hypothetical protein
MMTKCLAAMFASVVFLAVFAAPAGSQTQSKPTMQQLLANRNADDGAPKVGDVAPLFNLDLRFNGSANEKSVDLNQQVGRQPILLIFGSYT